MFCRVVWARRPPSYRLEKVCEVEIPQNDVSAIIPNSRDNRYYTLFGDRKKMVAMGSSLDGVYGNTQRPVCTIFEPDREGETAG